MDARERYDYFKEALRVERMRRGLGQSTQAEVAGRENDLRMATRDLLRAWWCGLDEAQRQALLKADGQPDRVQERVLATSPDDTISELLVPVEGVWTLPEWLRYEPCD